MNQPSGHKTQNEIAKKHLHLYDDKVTFMQ